MTVKKPECEVKSMVTCNGQIVRRVKGPKRGDRVFLCCIGCRAYLSRMGVRVKDAKE